MIDARISVALPSHPKTKKLIKRAGTDAAWRLVCLFLWAAQNKPDGNLCGMLSEDIELSVDWPGEDGVFVSSLVSVGFLDGNEKDGYVIHDWTEHNPWAAGSEDRSEKAKFNALCKHHGRDEAARRMPEYAEKHAQKKKEATKESASRKDEAQTKSATSMHIAESSTAPSPSPSPSPINTSEAKASGGNPPKVPDAEIIFSYGVSLLTAAGSTEKQARTFLGGLRKFHKDEAIVDKLRDCIKAKPLQPLEWLAAALPPGGSGAGKPSRHSGFENIDYRAGVTAEGRF